MKIDLKIMLPYIAILISLGMTWGMWSQRLEAVEAKADSVNQMQQDIAVYGNIIFKSIFIISFPLTD